MSGDVTEAMLLEAAVALHREFDGLAQDVAELKICVRETLDLARQAAAAIGPGPATPLQKAPDLT